MIALILLCSLIYGAVFLHEKATRQQVLFSVLSVAGVIVLAVYASGIGSGSVPGFFTCSARSLPVRATWSPAARAPTAFRPLSAHTSRA